MFAQFIITLAILSILIVISIKFIVPFIVNFFVPKEEVEIKGKNEEELSVILKDLQDKKKELEYKEQSVQVLKEIQTIEARLSKVEKARENFKK